MLVKAKARLRYISIPPRKMRLVANMVKGLPVEKALNILNFTPRIAAHHIAKTVKSAAANALSVEGTDNLHPESLMVRDITVDAAPTNKRIRFQSMGRVFRIRKRHCHLTVQLEAEMDVTSSKKTSAIAKKSEEVDTKGDGSTSGKKTKARKTTAKKTTTRKTTEKKRVAKLPGAKPVSKAKGSVGKKPNKTADR